MDYHLYLPKNTELKRAINIWLFQAVMALALAGILAIIIVIARTPFLQELLPVKNYFDIALIVHVDLSVLVWMLSVAAIMWTSSVAHNFAKLSIVAAKMAFVGTLLIFFSGFYLKGAPIKNNYIPVITNFPFFLGLAIFLTSITFQAFLNILSPLLPNFPKTTLTKPLYIVAYTSSIITIFAMMNFVLSYQKILNFLQTEALSSYEFYEYAFWGAGHVLQFVYVQILLLSWLIIANFMGIFKKLSAKLVIILMWLNVIFVAATLYPYMRYQLVDAEFISFFTTHMIWLSGIVPSLIAFILLYGFFKNFSNLQNLNKPASSAFMVSILLFFFGGLLGTFIQGTNVVVPAHYHGSIIGASIGLMGFVYMLLPRLGFAPITGKLALSQPYIYGFGQLMHITALAYSGGYGVMRKSPEIAETMKAKLSMGVMGIGGLLSIFGGLLFVVLVLKTMKNGRIEREEKKFYKHRRFYKKK